MRVAPSAAEIGHSLFFYPVVGTMIGGLLAALAVLLGAAPAPVRAALLIVAWVLLTGAMHLDGLADSADAWGGSRGDKERALTIMKDPCAGPMGVTAIVVVLLVKFAALASLAPPLHLTALVFSAGVARAMVIALFLTTEYVRAAGLGKALAEHTARHKTVLILVLTGVFVAALAINIVALCVALGVFLLLRAMMRRAIGGTTGDTAGALIEITEAALLIAFVFQGANR